MTGESSDTNNCSGSVQVTVREPEPARVVVTPDEVTFASLGDTATLTARVLDAQDNEIFGEAVSWSSNFPNVAAVNAAGVATAVANGRADGDGVRVRRLRCGTRDRGPAGGFRGYRSGRAGVDVGGRNRRADVARL